MFKQPNSDILVGICISSLFWIGVVAYSSAPHAGQRCEGTAAECAKAAVDERLTYYTGWLAALTGGLVVTALGQGYFLLRSDRTARIAAEAAKKSAEAAYQSAEANIAVESARLAFYPRSHDYWHAVGQYADRWPNSAEMKLNGKVMCEFYFHNYGKTPATLQEITVVLKRTAEIPQNIYINSPIFDLPTETVIAPEGDSEKFKTEISEFFTLADAIEVSHGISDLWIYGRVVYDDVFSREGTQHFLYKLKPRGGFTRYFDKTEYRIV